jgi:hypothetical protein
MLCHPRQKRKLPGYYGRDRFGSRVALTSFNQPFLREPDAVLSGLAPGAKLIGAH